MIRRNIPIVLLSSVFRILIIKFTYSDSIGDPGNIGIGLIEKFVTKAMIRTI